VQKKGKAVLGEGIANPYPRRAGIGSPDPRKITTCFTTDMFLIMLFPSSRMLFLSSNWVGPLSLLVPLSSHPSSACANSTGLSYTR